jgi:hypothetical protein
VSLIPGCADDAVEACVCALDDLCCDVSNGWDALCVTEVDLHGCGDCGGAQATKGLCCEANGSPGCDDPTIEACVCAEDPFCCDPQQTWDALCVSKVDELACGSCGGETPTKGDCCEGHDTPGCSDLAVQSCVCADDNWCCTNTWDALCASKVGVLGCGTCQAPEQVCTDTCQFANDQLCDDGGPESDYSACAYGSDCADCGPRDPM